MTTPSEKLAAAKLKPRRYVDVDILLDSGVSDARDEVQAKLDAAIAAAESNPRLAAIDPAIAELQEALDKVLLDAAGSVATIRVIALPGDAWSDIESRSPARPGSPGDALYGYNTQAAAQKALAYPDCAGWLVDGEVVPLVVIPSSPGVAPVDEWADLFQTISGTETQSLESAVWEVNVANPQVILDDIKKALATRPA